VFIIICCAEEISWIRLVEAIVATSGQFDPKAQVEVEAIGDSFLRLRKSPQCSVSHFLAERYLITLV